LSHMQDAQKPIATPGPGPFIVVEGFAACYAAGCHEIVWESPGLALFRACPEHRREKA